MPIEADIATIGKGEALVSSIDAQVYLPKGLGRTAIVINSTNPGDIEEIITQLMSKLPASPTGGEPLIN